MAGNSSKRRPHPWLLLSAGLNLLFAGTLLVLGLRWASRITGEAGSGLTPHQMQRGSHLATLALDHDDIVFLGDSLTERAEWSELLGLPAAKNRGVAGDTTADVLARTKEIAAARPAAIFIMVGINDLEAGRTPRDIVSTYSEILDVLETNAPKTRVFVQSVLPVHPGADDVEISNEAVSRVNAALRDLVRSRQIPYVDVFSALADAQGRLETSFTRDGVHLNGKGYSRWRDVLQRLLP